LLPAFGDRLAVPFDPLSLLRLLISAANCSAGGGAPAVSAVHAAGLKLGVLPSSLPASNALISAYSLTGLLPSSVHAFALLPRPSTGSYTMVLSALSLFASSAVAPDAELLSCLVSCCCCASAFLPARAVHAYGVKNVSVLAFYASARRVFGYMDGDDVVSWNSMIGGSLVLGWTMRRGMIASRKCAQEVFEGMLVHQ
jgi:hypothetical protein